MLKLKKIARFILDTHVWNPAKARVLYNHRFRLDSISGKSNEIHMKATLAWLKRAHDKGDGGVAGRYLLDRGWTDPYPETSGYIIPTLLEIGEHLDDPDCVRRAEKIIGFLNSVQMDNGAFPGGEYNRSSKSNPIVFNTGQIMLGLVAWYRKTGDSSTADSLKKAADWLLEVQEPDGSWLQHTYGRIKTAYHTRVAWPLALCGKVFSEEKYAKAAARFVEWVLKNTNHETGWVSRMGFDEEDHHSERSVTHTLAYTYRGLLEYALLDDRQDIINLVSKAMENIIDHYDSCGFLSAVLDSKWQNVEKSTCLTGNCQLAIIWLKLYGINNNKRFLTAAEKILTSVKNYQSLHSFNGGIRGGICGSVPLWGSYIRYGYPNWAAKFFIDALLLLVKATP